MLAFFNCLSRSALFWIAMIGTCAILEGVALYFQYALDYGPCVLCVHIRAWIAAILVIGLLALFMRNSKPAMITLNAAGVIATAGMLERAYLTLGIERGFVDGSCTLNASFPTWLPLDQWWPAVFEPWEACGYTPELVFGITMAEALIVTAALWTLLMLALLVSSLTYPAR